MTKKGKFIVIEGSDGSGKKTQTDIIIKKLRKRKKKVTYCDFPQYRKTFFALMIERYLNGEFGEADDVSPYLASILFAGDRFQASEKIKKSLDRGEFVISNRYIQSNMAFNGAKIKSKEEKEKYISWLEEMEYEVFNIPKADLIIYLYVPYLIGQKLVDQKAKRNYTDLKRDIHEKNSNFLKRVETEYLKLAKENREWEIIDCTFQGKLLSIEDISIKIEKILVRKKVL